MPANLDKYSPKTASIFDSFKIDTSLPKEEQAFNTWKALLTAKRSYEALFLVIGKLLKNIRDEKFYQILDYESFSQFLNSEELGFSREKAYMCIRVYEYYIEYLKINYQKLSHMNISRLSMMIPMLKDVKDKEKQIEQIEEFSAMRHNDFIREVKQKTNKDGKPNVFFSEESAKWIIQYHNNKCILMDLGEFNGETETQET